jgi:hypothetical protein
LATLLLSSLVLVEASGLVTRVSQDQLSIGAITGLVTATTNALMHFLWARRAGLEAFRAVELHNEALLTWRIRQSSRSCRRGTAR